VPSTPHRRSVVDRFARAKRHSVSVRALCSILLAVLTATAPSIGVAAAPSAKPEREAAAAVKKAKAAARKGDYVTALAEFGRANAISPSAAVHFNIGVCHHSLMVAADPASPEHATHRDAAITAYRAYLDADPQASDRADVEKIIAEITPAAPEDPAPPPDATPPGPPPALREAVTRIDPDPPTPEPQPTPAPMPETLPSERSPARVGPFIPVVLAHLGRIGDTNRVEELPLIGLGIRGGAFLGPRARLNLGGELAVYGQPSDGKRRHRLLDAHVAVTVDYGVKLGRKQRFEIAGGGLLGFLYESLHADGAPPVRCPKAADDRVAQRGGLLIGPRLSLLLLLGKRRNHELGLRITPALAVSTQGNEGAAPEGEDACEQTPFAEVGLPGGAALVTTVDLGYAPRF
jgi:tetratricopeptide (TPR) repeat protein